MGVGTGGGGGGGGGTGGTCPPNNLPSEILFTQYALLSRKLTHKMFIFNKISGSLRSPIKILVTKKSTNSNVQIILPHLFKTFLY